MLLFHKRVAQPIRMQHLHYSTKNIDLDKPKRQLSQTIVVRQCLGDQVFSLANDLLTPLTNYLLSAQPCPVIHSK